MYQEIDIGQDSKLLLYKNKDFWEDILPKTFEESSYIDVITYNFNFNNYSEKSFYFKLKDLASKGVKIRLLYAKETYMENEEILVEDVFKSFVLCAKLDNNHSKIFLSDKVAYIGSANFSVGSNNNYECGIIIKDIEVIEKIRKTFVTELIEASELISIPENPFDPLHIINDLIQTLETIAPMLSHDRDAILIDQNLELIPELRNWEFAQELLENSTINFEFEFDHVFDWLNFYCDCYENRSVIESEFQILCDFVPKFYKHLQKIKSKLVKLYETEGKENVIPQQI
ncbi:phospholipase D-like domain-containing protein [Vagococcus sp.]|uniref:phospholipase D-like domain-containing protein n=1 Tax=Vagococcus sp. TaxID=1933889 RepID=UPI002FC908E1